MKSFKEKLIQETKLLGALQFMQKNGINLFETVYRPGSESYFELMKTLKRENNNQSYLNEYGELSEAEREFLYETDIGEFDLYEGRSVPLDFPFINEEKDNDDMELNKPKRGGPKKFYVYVRDPKTKKTKKVSFGDTSGLRVKYNDSEARKSFVARHNCPEKKDKTKAGYWSCRLPRYWKALGLEKPEGNFRFW